MISPRLLFSTRQAFLTLVCLILTSGAASAQCKPPNLVTFTSAGAGTSWTLCWEMRMREGLVIHDATFTARNDTPRSVLKRASIAQVHVPYFPGSPRFHDITTSTSGLGANALNLSDSECAPTDRLDPKVCLQIQDRGLAWKFVSTSLNGQQATLWTSSQLGQYNYITQWTFKDDGSIEPSLGFTGRLQIINSGDRWAPFGTPVDAPASNRFAINHIHSIYWRLDFDIAEPLNNAVERLRYMTYTDPNPDFPSCADFPGFCATNIATQFLTEGSDLVTPFASWRVFNKVVTNPNGRTIGYEIEPEDHSAWYGEPTGEPWAQADFYVTRFNECETLAVDNRPPFIDASCEGAPGDVAAMAARGGDVDGQDVVVWVREPFQHFTREEDQLNMPIEFKGLHIQPRSWSPHSPME